MKSLEEIEILGGQPAVDFVNTVHDWHQPEPPDYLQGFDDFVRWCEMAGLIRDSGPLFRNRPEAEKEAAFAEVRKLRASLHELFAAVARGESLPADALEYLNEVVRRTVKWRRLAPSSNDPGIACQWDFDDAPPIALLGPVAWKAAELLELGPLDRLKECPADSCGWLFVDTSRNRSRTWCSMATCGNNAKVRRFRKRHASGELSDRVG